MIDSDSETLVTTTQAARIMAPAGARPVAASTVWRWIRNGVNGAKLESIRIGRRIFTSQEAISRFIKKQASNLEISNTGESQECDAAIQAELQESGLA